MDEQEVVDALNNVDVDFKYNKEIRHIEAEGVILEYLEREGKHEIVAKYKEMSETFWYA